MSHEEFPSLIVGTVGAVVLPYVCFSTSNAHMRFLTHLRIDVYRISICTFDVVLIVCVHMYILIKHCLQVIALKCFSDTGPVCCLFLCNFVSA